MSFIWEHMPFAAREGDPVAGAVSVLLSPAGTVYSSVMRARRYLYEAGIIKSKRPPCRVVSVGNLFAGGGGKTQVALSLAREAFKAGVSAALVSGGYGGSARESGRPARIVAGENPALGGDEAVMLADEACPVPVYVSRDRYSGCVMAVDETGASLCILDDAAQHLLVHRDVNVIVTDPENPFGNGRCIPAGPLRETPSAMGTADIVWLAGGAGTTHLADLEKPIRRYNTKAPIIVSGTRPGKLVKKGPGGKAGEIDPRGLRVVALTGIARPWRFYDSLIAAGAVVTDEFRFPDHHVFTEADLSAARKKALKDRSDLIVTTAKDDARSGSIFSSALDGYGVLGTDLVILSGFEHIERILKG